ncbi:MAG: glycosyltransferase family 2 protein, partial [Chloroflexota bacterium]|nr:glycosyltransferase family 2 protein [Chloroflexota bacterium]
ALTVRATAVQQVGGLDDDFFMYCEEMDWCLRLAEAGWSTVAVPTARVIHHEGQSSRQVRWAAYERLWRSRFRFYAKHRQRYRPGYLTLVRLLVRAGLARQKWQAEQRFAHGQMTGEALQAELTAYATVAQMICDF